MKKLIFGLLSISFLSMMLIVTTGSKAQAQDVSVSYQDFYDQLAPYGQWIDDPDYGSVWVPNEGSDFRPYGSHGYWAMTDYGNTWVSDDPFGWAVYHYGRWTYNPYYGWIWIPGYEWAPAWVSWRYGGGYCGWAPLGPGYYVGANYGCPDSWWVFLGPDHLYGRDHYNYWGDRRNNHRFINQTTIINNVYTDNSTHVRYNYGPRASTIEQATHRPVQVYKFNPSARAGAAVVQRNTINMYRPSVVRSTVSTARPGSVITAPMRVGKPQDATVNGGGGQTNFRKEEEHQTQVTNQRGTEQRNNVGQNSRTPEPVRTNPAPAANNQNERNNATPQYFNHQPTNPQPARVDQPHFSPPPAQNRPEPPRNNPAPQQQQQRYNPPPQQQRSNPAPQPQQQRSNPQPQQSRPQPGPARGGGHR